MEREGEHGRESDYSGRSQSRKEGTEVREEGVEAGKGMEVREEGGEEGRREGW